MSKIMRPAFEAKVETIPIAINFDREWLQVDTRLEDDQVTTIAFVRPLEGPKRLYTGIAVKSPKDLHDDDLGRKISLGRALYAMLDDLAWRRSYSPQECYSLARKILWNQRLDQKRLEQEQKAEALVATPEGVLV